MPATLNGTQNPENPLFCYRTYLAGKFMGATGGGTSRAALGNRTLSVLMDCSTKWQRKPRREEVGRVSLSMERNGKAYRGMTAELLAKGLSMGYPVMGGICIGGRKAENWTGQQVWFIDIDNDPEQSARGYYPLPYTDAVLRAQRARLPLIISYETFSSSRNPNAGAGDERYRLVFATEEPITDRAEAERYGDYLLANFREADQSCTQANRMIYGTDKEVILWVAPIA